MGMATSFAAVDPATMERLRSDPDSIEAYLYPEDEDGDQPNLVDVDKAWHGIHYLLTGTADGGEPPLSWEIFGGTEVGEDMGYGPARILTPAQVAAIAAALPAEEVLAAAYSPEAMEAAQIYPDIIWTRDGDEALEYVIENYRFMVEFYRDAAARGDGALVWIS